MPRLPRWRRSSSLPHAFGIANVPLDRDGALALEPALAGVFRRAVHWTGAVSVSNPLALTRAYAARFAALGGLALIGDARTLASRPILIGALRPRPGRSMPATSCVALGPWALDVAEPARHQSAARRQARLSPPFSPAGKRHAEPPGSRRREWLRARADGAGHPHHDRRRIRRPRCAANARAI